MAHLFGKYLSFHRDVLNRTAKFIFILRPRCHSKIIGHILKNKQKNKCVCTREIIRLIIMKMKMKMKKKDYIDTT